MCGKMFFCDTCLPIHVELSGCKHNHDSASTSSTLKENQKKKQDTDKTPKTSPQFREKEESSTIQLLGLEEVYKIPPPIYSSPPPIKKQVLPPSPLPISPIMSRNVNSEKQPVVTSEKSCIIELHTLINSLEKALGEYQKMKSFVYTEYGITETLFSTRCIFVEGKNDLKILVALQKMLIWSNLDAQVQQKLEKYKKGIQMFVESHIIAMNGCSKASHYAGLVLFTKTPSKFVFDFDSMFYSGVFVAPATLNDLFKDLSTHDRSGTMMLTDLLKHIQRDMQDQSKLELQVMGNTAKIYEIIGGGLKIKKKIEKPRETGHKIKTYYPLNPNSFGSIQPALKQLEKDGIYHFASFNWLEGIGKDYYRDIDTYFLHHSSQKLPPRCTNPSFGLKSEPIKFRS
jgi:hypothetical protein